MQPEKKDVQIHWKDVSFLFGLGTFLSGKRSIMGPRQALLWKVQVGKRSNGFSKGSNDFPFRPIQEKPGLGGCLEDLVSRPRMGRFFFF